VTFDGLDGRVQGAFQPFTARLGSQARVKLVPLNLIGDLTAEVVLFVKNGGPGVPRLSAFTATGSRIV
jgi:hypothetical protein